MPYLARMACLAALLTGLAYADADLPNTTAGYNRIQLAAEARRDVPNDTLNATLFTEEAHADPARLARQLNDKVAAALRLAPGVSQVKTSSGTLSTWPVYEANNRLTGWRGRAEVRLESRDFEKAAQLIGRLQSGMQVGQVSFSVSPAARKAAEAVLIPEAMQVFRDKALLVTQTLGAKDYRLVTATVDSQQSGAAPLFRAPRMAAGQALAVESLSAPSFAPGESDMTVRMNGTIEARP